MPRGIGVTGLVARNMSKREFIIDNLLVRIRFIIVMIRWTGLAPWDLEFHFRGGLTSTSLKRNWNFVRVFELWCRGGGTCAIRGGPCASTPPRCMASQEFGRVALGCVAFTTRIKCGVHHADDLGARGVYFHACCAKWFKVQGLVVPGKRSWILGRSGQRFRVWGG